MNKYRKVIESFLENGVIITIKKIIYVRRQEKFLKFYYNKDTLFKAVKIGEKIVKMAPLDLYNYQKLARAYWKNRNDDRAIKTLRRGIKVNYNKDLEEIISEIERNISNKSIFLSNNFIFKGGHENYGLIEHILEDKILLTKILTVKQANGEFIVKELQKKLKTFKSITPNILNILKVDDLCFVTMERIDGIEPGIIDIDLIEKVYEINSSITSVRNCDFFYPLNEQTITQNIEPVNIHELFKTFYLVNQKNIEVFSLIKQFILKNNNHLKSLQIIDYLNNIAVGHKYYERINTAKHFSLQHGDFFQDNMLFNNQSEDLKLIDWGGIRFGPRWVDIAVFLAVTKQPFYDILHNFLDHNRCDYDPVEKLFFIYTLIATWLVTFNKEDIQDCHQSYCGPALKYIATLMEELEKEEVIKRSS
ncbi:phosphotransferase [Neobacillus terrae]|uniref:phosphotransferase n=1 Tax=Neobacillus terrae TaxID=3034837 RepID=UPI00140B8612|nr:phosphotransferase [Neobacillus terrae]NHM29271.1 phosphotransferase [Neobacillus terrae]